MDAVEAKAAANETAIGTLNGDGEGSVAKAVADAEDRVKVTTDAIAGRVSTLETTVNTDHKGRIEALEAKFGEGDDSVDSKITAAIEALDTPEAGVTGDGTYVDVTVKQVDGKVTAVVVAENDIASAQGLSDEVTRATNVENAINAKIGGNYGTGEGQVTVAADIQAAKDAAAAAQADIDAFLVTTETDNGVLDTLKEIQDFLTSDEGTVQTLLDKVTTNETAIATLNGDATTAGSVAKAVADAKTEIYGEIEDNERVTSEALTDLDARVDALEGLSAGTEISDIKGRLATLETEVNTNIPQDIAGAQAAAEAAAAADATSKANTAENNAKGYADGLIEALDATVKDEADYVTGEIVQENGKLTSVAFTVNTGSVAAAEDGLALASDVKTYADGLWVWEEFA